MFSEQKVKIRWALIERLRIGGSITVPVGTSNTDEVADLIRKFGKSRKRGFIIKTAAQAIEVSEVALSTLKRPPGRPASAPDQLKYPIATLAVGDSVLVKVPRTDHAKLRKYASGWAQRYNWKLSCNVEGEALRVTRTA